MAITIPARQGAHTLLQCGQQIRVINPSGHQVVDLWAFPITSVPSWMSMAQSRQKFQRVRPIVNDTFVDIRRQPVLTLVEDVSSGIHDIIYPPCDNWRYTEAGKDGHDSCAGNLRRELVVAIASSSESEGAQTGCLTELEERIRTWGWTPEPLNLFMNVRIGSVEGVGDGHLNVTKPCCKAGDYVVLRADVDCLIVMSSCPNDLLDTNGGNPSASAYEILI